MAAAEENFLAPCALASSVRTASAAGFREELRHPRTWLCFPAEPEFARLKGMGAGIRGIAAYLRGHLAAPRDAPPEQRRRSHAVRLAKYAAADTEPRLATELLDKR
ncbi:MAG: hypothetical protein OXI87_25020 [Albidovulum sp.]|nr:hypothetical protein [Albidovulum sp.]MDE0308119.1 hypothetical protein [Albidovulum sp.]